MLKDFPLFRFVKERGDLEKEYARGLRKLVARWVNIEEFGLLIVNQKRNWVLEIKKCKSTLFARFTPKDRKKGAPPESSQTSCFRSSIVIIVYKYKYKYIYEFTIVIRLLLCEVGYQAGQHELLSESLGTLLYKDCYILISWCMNIDFEISKLDFFIRSTLTLK